MNIIKYSPKMLIIVVLFSTLLITGKMIIDKKEEQIATQEKVLKISILIKIQ